MKKLMYLSNFVLLFVLFIAGIIWLCNGDMTRVKTFLYWNITVSGILWIINFFTPQNEKN